MPKTYFFPEDLPLFEEQLIKNEQKKFGSKSKKSSGKENSLPTYIAKPSKGYGGQGIILIQSEADLPTQRD